ncbi:MAG: hypothetical protein WC866_04545 [Patescibacteria group bacterium]|jgi:hypothetical protein
MPVIVVRNAFALDRKSNTLWRQNEEAANAERRHQDLVLVTALQDATLAFKGLGEMAREDIAVHIDAGVGLPSDVTLISVEVLFDKPERTIEVRTAFAEALKKAALECYAACKLKNQHLVDPKLYKVEVAVRRFDPKNEVYI